MQCNIDEKGARFRRTWGILNLLVATLLAALALWSGIYWLLIISAALFASGAFAIFEAQKKWCALRAMGIKTRM